MLRLYTKAFGSFCPLREIREDMPTTSTKVRQKILFFKPVLSAGFAISIALASPIRTSGSPTDRSQEDNMGVYHNCKTRGPPIKAPK